MVGSIVVGVVLVALGCFLLPGYLGYLAFLPCSTRLRPSRWGELALGWVLGSTLWTGAWATLLVQLGRFTLRGLLLGNLAVSLCLAAANAVRGGPWTPSARPITRKELAVLAALVLALGVYMHPHEFVLGGADAGVYVALGQHIAATGNWQAEEPVIAALPTESLPMYFRQQPLSAPARFVHLPGFYLTEPAAGEITPQFYPLHPLWLAILNAAGGLRASLYVTPLWGVLSAACVGAMAGRLFSARVGWLSATLLLCTAPQVWFSRYQSSEVLTQYLIFGGLWALVIYLREGTAWHGLLAGAALGQTMVARLDTYFLIALPLGLGLWRLWKGRLSRTGLWVAVPFALHVAQSLLFAWTRTRPYFLSIYGDYLDVVARPLGIAVVAGSILALAGLAAAVRRLSPRLRSTQNRRVVDHWLTIGARLAAVLVVMLALYAYFVRPALADTDRTWPYWYGAYDVPFVEPYNLVRLGWYLTPLGLVLAAAGTFLVLWRRPTVAQLAMVSTGLFYSIFFIVSSRNNPHHIYVMRRYVPVTIPFLMTMAAYAVDTLWRRLGIGRYLAAAVAVALVGWLLLEARLPLVHVEYDGLLDQLDAWVEGLGGPPAIVLFNDDRAVSAGALLGTPLHYLYGHDVLDLQEEFGDPAALAAQVDLWLAQGRRVLVAEGADGVPDLFAGLALQPLPEFQASYPVLEVSYEHKPRELRTQTLRVSFFDVMASP